MAALNILIRPGHVPPWLRPRLVGVLALIPLRPDGVRATLEFVFSVHPSSTMKVSEVATTQKRGANITHESLEMASRLVSVPPSSVTAERWYSAVAPQLLTLLDGEAGPELMKTAAYVIGFGILGRKASGAPGMLAFCEQSSLAFGSTLLTFCLSKRDCGLEISGRADA